MSRLDSRSLTAAIRLISISNLFVSYCIASFAHRNAPSSIPDTKLNLIDIMSGGTATERPRTTRAAISPWTDPTRPSDHLHPETDESGNIEYKLKLVSPSSERFEKLVTQLKWRLLEGNGEAIYELGVLDSGLLVGLDIYELRSSLSTLTQMATKLGASLKILRQMHVGAGPSTNTLINTTITLTDNAIIIPDHIPSSTRTILEVCIMSKQSNTVSDDTDSLLGFELAAFAKDI